MDGVKWLFQSGVLLLCLAAAKDSWASAPSPLVTASASQNGKYLVVTQVDLAPAARPDEGRRILGTTYRVLYRESFANANDRLVTNVPFYSSGCEVTLTGREGVQQFWPMISNDGVSLVLIAVTPADTQGAMLKIYRCDSAQGRLIRDVGLIQLWSADHIPKGPQMIRDSTPEWFAGGSLDFSAAGDVLTYKTPWHERVDIVLRER